MKIDVDFVVGTPSEDMARIMNNMRECIDAQNFINAHVRAHLWGWFWWDPWPWGRIRGRWILRNAMQHLSDRLLP